MTLDLDALIKVFAILGVVLGVWWRLQDQITRNSAMHQKELAEFKILVAEKYASHDAMKEALGPLVKELHGLRERLDRLIDRRAAE